MTYAYFFTRLFSSNQPQKLTHAQSRLVENVSECADSNDPVIWHDDASRRFLASKDHVAPSLSLKHEADALHCRPHLAPG